MQTKFKIKLPANLQAVTVRGLLQQWLVPKKWQHFLRTEQKITVNQYYRNFNELVNADDIVTLDFVFLPTNQQTYLPDHQQHVAVLYEDDTTLIVNKPAGIKTHPNRPDENGTLMNILAANYPNIYIVHRLDQQTSGAILVAKSTVAVPIYNRQLTLKTMARHYLAWVEDVDSELTSGQISLPIGQDTTDSRKRCIDYEQGLAAITNYRVIKQRGQQSLLAISLETGRTHQIRVHLAAIGHPIIGDPLYNPKTVPNQPMLLHGDQLIFTPPFAFEPLRVTAPLSNYFPK